MAPTHRRGPWLPEEDRLLLELVHTQGPNNWVGISQNIQHRSPKQCRERFHQNLKPTLNHEPISSHEGEMIEQMVTEMGKRWAEIARRLGSRSDNAVKNWWNGSMNRRKRNVVQHDHAMKSVGSRLHPIPFTSPARQPSQHIEPHKHYESSQHAPGHTRSIDSKRDGRVTGPLMNHPTSHRLIPSDASRDFLFAGEGRERVLPSLNHFNKLQTPIRHTSSWLLQTPSEPNRQTPSFPLFERRTPHSLNSTTFQPFQQPLISPAATEHSEPHSLDRAPSLISDNNSNTSISPRTIPSPRLPAPIDTRIQTWSEQAPYGHESAPAILPKSLHRDNVADEGYVWALPASASSDIKPPFSTLEHGPCRYPHSISKPVTASGLTPPAIARDARMNFSTLLNAD